MFELIPFDRRGSRVSAYDPFRMLDDMERSFFGGANHPAVSSFRTDVTDTGDAFVLDAELPGFKKEDIKIDVENDCLTIHQARALLRLVQQKLRRVRRERRRHRGGLQRRHSEAHHAEEGRDGSSHETAGNQVTQSADGSAF